MSDFLLELRSEEIPARMQAWARNQLHADLETALRDAGVPLDGQAIRTYSTPRRLAIIVPVLPAETKSVSEEIKGPRTSAPEQALDGFLRKTGLTKDQLTERDGVYFAITQKPGRPIPEVLADITPPIVRAFHWPKSMRWGAASLSTESLRWVRPLSGIVALLDGEVVDFEIDGIRSGRMTMGHRFHSHGEFAVIDPASYAGQLRSHHVIVDHQERESIIRRGAAEVAASAGLLLVEDEGLVIENAGLTEWPVPLLGRFDEAFLEVPPEVIQLTARINQKYFICRDGAGKLANAFICTANIVAADGGEAIVAGNRKVLAARLSDARFFWEQDRKKTLAEQAAKLDRITFHEKLGTVADKVERVAKLARWLVEQGIVSPLPLAGGAGGGHLPSSDCANPDVDAHPNPSRKREGREDRAALADLAEQAARLCKADLVTEMVGEFPELQGLMGGNYARAEGLPDAVADAIRDHYKPVGQGDDVPTMSVTVALSLADKIDTLVGFYGANMAPSGSKDPFALRRAALAASALILSNNLRFGLRDAFSIAWSAYQSQSVMLDDMKLPELLDFVIYRLKVQQRDLGVRHDIIDAIYKGNAGGIGIYGQFADDLVRLLARVHALQNFVGTEDGSNLLAGYKRAANILKKEGFTAPLPLAAGVRGGHSDAQPQHPDLPTPDPCRKREGDYAPEPAEAALIAGLEIAAPRAEAAIAAEDFAAAMTALASLRHPIDAFFDQVTVNDPDETKRAARFGLLDQFRAAVHKVADFSLIEG